MRPGLLLLAVLVVGAFPVASRATTCATFDVTLVFPKSGATAPTNTQVFLMQWQPGVRGVDLRLVHKKSGKRVACKLEPRRASGMVRLVPRSPLKPGTAYEVRHRKKVLGWFKADDSLSVPARPQLRLGRAVLVFSRPVAVGFLSRGGGLDATLKLAAGPGPPPAVLEVELSFVTGKVQIRSGLAEAFGNELQVASNSLCSPMASAPPEGSYTLKAIPWSAGGEQGRLTLLTGQVKAPAGARRRAPTRRPRPKRQSEGAP
jgi:hypothetical protein